MQCLSDDGLGRWRLCTLLAVLAAGMVAPEAMGQGRADVGTEKQVKPAIATTQTSKTTTSKTTTGALKKSERPRQIPPLTRGRRALVPFKTAPFPYTGVVPATSKPFLDVHLENRSGHAARSGEVLWADVTYSDSRVLLDLPAGFNANRRGVLVVFLHGNGATLERDVVARQQVPQQAASAGINSAVVAPQFASDAADSSAGKFWAKDALTAFLDEVALSLARLLGDVRAKPRFDAMPVVLVAYSGGYYPLSYLLHHGGSAERILGVIVLDGLYGEQPRFADWIAQHPKAFFFVGYGPSSNDGTLELARLLAERRIPVATILSPDLVAGNVTLLATPTTVVHADFVSKAWTDRPLRDLLRRIPGFPRPSKP